MGFDLTMSLTPMSSERAMLMTTQNFDTASFDSRMSVTPLRKTLIVVGSVEYAKQAVQFLYTFLSFEPLVKDVLWMKVGI
jgi:hypothetical protein